MRGVFMDGSWNWVPAALPTPSGCQAPYEQWRTITPFSADKPGVRTMCVTGSRSRMRCPARRCRPRSRTSGHDAGHDVPKDVRKAVVTSLETVGEPLVVQAEQVEEGRVQVMDMDGSI